VDGGGGGGVGVDVGPDSSGWCLAAYAAPSLLSNRACVSARVSPVPLVCRSSAFLPDPRPSPSLFPISVYSRPSFSCLLRVLCAALVPCVGRAAVCRFRCQELAGCTIEPPLSTQHAHARNLTHNAAAFCLPCVCEFYHRLCTEFVTIWISIFNGWVSRRNDRVITQQTQQFRRPRFERQGISTIHEYTTGTSTTNQHPSSRISPRSPRVPSPPAASPAGTPAAPPCPRASPACPHPGTTRRSSPPASRAAA